MFNYNVINPVNIHYRKYPNNEGINQAGEEQKPLTPDSESQGRKFPNGNKVAIDYTKNQINISQILQDFRSTIAAINTPDDIKEEVESYLAFTSRESSKEAPSREVILSNLKNAARITDKYIEDSLKKPSKVVQDWVDALFMQQINLKANPNEINEEFRVKIPPKQTQNPQYTTISQTTNHSGIKPLNEDKVEFGNSPSVETKIEQIEEPETPVVETSSIFEQQAQLELQEAFENEPVVIEPVKQEKTSPYAPKTQKEALAKETLLAAKATFEKGGNLYSALKLYDEALTLVEGSDNVNLKSAIYYERGKIFDANDYAEMALIDYNKATKSKDGNLRAQARIKMGNIYDDYVQFDPAMYQYSRAIEDSEEVNNLQGKTKALRCIASMFAGIYDTDNTETFSELAMESAKETKNPKTITKTYLEVADNYKYLGEDSKALKVYGALAQEEAVKDDYSALAQNYMEAAMLMDKKGNKKKSYALMLKGKEYQRLARLKRNNA